MLQHHSFFRLKRRALRSPSIKGFSFSKTCVACDAISLAPPKVGAISRSPPPQSDVVYLKRTPERARNLAQTRSARSPPVHPSRQPVQRFSKWQFPVRDKAHHGTLLEHQTYLIPKPKHPSPHWSCSFLSQHLIPILLHSAKSAGQLQNRQGPKTPSL